MRHKAHWGLKTLWGEGEGMRLPLSMARLPSMASTEALPHGCSPTPRHGCTTWRCRTRLRPVCRTRLAATPMGADADSDACSGRAMREQAGLEGAQAEAREVQAAGKLCGLEPAQVIQNLQHIWDTDRQAVLLLTSRRRTSRPCC